MSDMVEMVARALFLRDVEEDVCDGTWEENVAIHPRILADARAAIQAMRGPTDSMYAAGYSAGTGDWGGKYDNRDELARGRIQPSWQAMIDEALR